MKKKSPHVVLGVSGSIAAVKTPELVSELKEMGCRVSVVMTKSATQFVTPLSLAALSGEPVLVDMFDADAYQMPHVKLTNQADILVVAPATIAVMGRMVHGIAEDLVTLTYVTATFPTLLAPGMHDTMWRHAANENNVRILKSRGVNFVGPVKGRLADGTTEMGRMAEPKVILKEIKKFLKLK